MHVSTLSGAEAFTTKDGSEIRELVHPAWTPAENQSLAEATVPAGTATTAHYHPKSEELYFFTHGAGRMRLGDEEREIRAGDCVVIPPGVEHKLFNDGAEPLRLLCCCSPPYSHEDTVLTEAEPEA